MRTRRAGLLVAAALSLPLDLYAQDPRSAPPQIVVSASHEVEVAPDRAHLTIAVESRGRTSQLASQDNARIASAVVQAVGRAGIAAAQIRTLGLSVQPEYRYPDGGGRPTVVGYVATNRVLVEVRDLARVGGVIDAAIAQGATNINGPTFGLSNPDSARREALAVAVARARADAEVMARAAGQRVGGVLELTSQDAFERPMFDRAPVMAFARGAEAAPETPVSAGTITIRAQVTIRVAIVGVP